MKAGVLLSSCKKNVTVTWNPLIPKHVHLDLKLFSTVVAHCACYVLAHVMPMLIGNCKPETGTINIRGHLLAVHHP